MSVAALSSQRWRRLVTGRASQERIDRLGKRLRARIWDPLEAALATNEAFLDAVTYPSTRSYIEDVMHRYRHRS